MYSYQKSKVTYMWKITYVECLPVVFEGVHRVPNAIASQQKAGFFSSTCQKMRGGKYVTVKKQQRQNIQRFRADARKLI